MVFHLRITLTGVHKETDRSIIAIGDTLQIEKDGSFTWLTSKIQKKYNDISYSLEDSEDEADAVKEKQRKEKVSQESEISKPAAADVPKKAKKSESSGDSEGSDDEDEEGGDSGEDDEKEIVKQGLTGQIMIASSRLRSKANNQKEKQGEMEDRKQH